VAPLDARAVVISAGPRNGQTLSEIAPNFPQTIEFKILTNPAEPGQTISESGRSRIKVPQTMLSMLYPETRSSRENQGRRRFLAPGLLARK